MDKETILDRAIGMYASTNYIDVVQLANSFGLEVAPNSKVDNARVFVKNTNDFAIEVNPTHSLTRQRFSIAHELAHFILHKEDIIRLRSVDRDSSNSLDKAQEEAANSLAAEILMPEEIVKEFIESNKLNDEKPINEFTVAKVASFFNVSALVAVLRLRELKYYVPYIPFA